MLLLKRLFPKVLALCFVTVALLVSSSCNGVTVPTFPTPGPGMIKILSGHWLWVDVVRWSPDGKFLASGASDHTARVWDVASGKSIATMTFPDTFDVGTVAWSPDGNYLATGSGGKQDALQVWDTKTWQTAHKITPRGFIRDVEWSPDGKSLAVAMESSGAKNDPHDKGIDLYDIGSEQVTSSLVYSDDVSGITWSPDNRYIAFSGASSVSPQMAVWDVSKGGGQSNTSNTITLAERGLTGQGGWSPDGKLLAYSAEGDLIEVLNTSTWKVVATLSGHTSAAGSVAWSPDSKKIASGSIDETVLIWDVASGQLLKTLKHHDVVYDVAWSPDGSLLATACGDHNIYLWDASTLSAILTPGGP
jgi:WD40 repeat protein